MIKKVWNELDRFFNKVNKDHIPEYVGEASFFMILSFIPFIMLLFSLLQFTNIDRLSMMNMMNAIVPENMISFFSDIINEVYRGTTPVLQEDTGEYHISAKVEKDEYLEKATYEIFTSATSSFRTTQYYTYNADLNSEIP